MKRYEVEYQLNEDDLRAFFEYALPRTPRTRCQVRNRIITTCIIAVAVALVTLFVMDIGFPLKLVSLAWILIVSVILVLRAPRRVHRSQMNQLTGLLRIEKYRELLGYTKITLTSDGVSIADEGGASLRAWDAITEIRVDRDYLFLHTDEMMADIVPGLAFANQKAFEEFIDAAKRFKSTAAGNANDPLELEYFE